MLIASASALEIAKLAKPTMVLRRNTKKALTSAFFCGFLFLSSGLLSLAVTHSVTAEEFCAQATRIEPAKVKRIVDGDTLVLTDKRRVRLLGINTPEVNHKQANLSQPLGLEARARLKQLLSEGQTIQLYFDQKQQDSYKRLLARVITTDKIDIGEQLIKEGFARQYLIMPNQQCWQRYRAAEQLARKHNRGIWAEPGYQALPAKSWISKKQTRRFMRVTGTITAMEHSRRNLWFVLDDNLYLGISRKDLPAFNSAAGDQEIISKLKIGQSIEVSGFVYFSYEKLRVKIRHPQAIYFLSSNQLVD